MDIPCCVHILDPLVGMLRAALPKLSEILDVPQLLLRYVSSVLLYGMYFHGQTRVLERFIDTPDRLPCDGRLLATRLTLLCSAGCFSNSW